MRKTPESVFFRVLRAALLRAGAEDVFCFFLFISLLSPSFALEYRDSSGRTLVLEKSPERIIAVGPGAARLVAYLDSVEKLAATENIEIKYPKARPYTLAYYDHFKKLPVISEGGPYKIPDYERIISLKPDLIITCSLDGQLAAEIETKTKTKVFRADYGNLGTFQIEKFRSLISVLGELLGKKERASYLIKKTLFYEKDLKKRTSGTKKPPSVYAGGLGFKGSQGITSTQYSYEPFRLLGLKSVIDRKKSQPLHIFIDREKLLKLNPDFIFVDAGGAGIFSEDYAKNRKFYSLLKARERNDFYTTLPYNFYTTNVEIVFINAYFIGKTLFPENFADLEIEKKAGEIFTDFVGKNVYRELMEENNFYKRIKFGNEIGFEKIR